MKNTKTPLAITLFVACFGIITTGLAQFEASGQLIQRAEYCNGYGTLIPIDTLPAVFIASRTRMHLTYKTEKVTLYSSIQDVRTFGNTSQLKTTDPFLSTHEAWGEFKVDSVWSVKIGRQELGYDNFRFLGNVDWTLQGRSHDFILVKFEKNNFKLHAGGGYNQDREKLYGTTYTTSNQYKTAQLLRAEYMFKNFNLSALLWNDGRQYIVKDSTGKITKEGVRYMQTIGLPTIKYMHNNTTLSAYLYYQTGKDEKGKNVNAFDVSAQVSYLIKMDESKKRQFRTTLGGEMVSGTEKNSGSTNNSFSPLYGTNHAHNGYMDYFYVGTRHENSVGLTDLFLRLKFDVNKKLFYSINGHCFNSYANIYNSQNTKLNRYLGAEIDFSTGCILTESLSIQGGYSQIFASSSMATLRNSTKSQEIQNWAYVMFILRPKGYSRFVGLLF